MQSPSLDLRQNQDEQGIDEKRETRPHIPLHLPALPPVHTYKSTVILKKEKHDDKEAGRKSIKRKREAEQALYRVMQPPPPTENGGGWGGQPEHFGSLPELPRKFEKKRTRHTAQSKKNSLPRYQPKQEERSSRLGSMKKGDMILEVIHNWWGLYAACSLTIVLQHSLGLGLDLNSLR